MPYCSSWVSSIAGDQIVWTVPRWTLWLTRCYEVSWFVMCRFISSIGQKCVVCNSLRTRLDNMWLKEAASLPLPILLRLGLAAGFDMFWLHAHSCTKGVIVSKGTYRVIHACMPGQIEPEQCSSRRCRGTKGRKVDGSVVIAPVVLILFGLMFVECGCLVSQGIPILDCSLPNKCHWLFASQSAVCFLLIMCR